MGIIGKVTPKIYEYLRFAGKSSVLEVKPISIVNVSGLKYNAKFTQSLKYKPEELIKTEPAFHKDYHTREGDFLIGYCNMNGYDIDNRFFICNIVTITINVSHGDIAIVIYSVFTWFDMFFII